MITDAADLEEKGVEDAKPSDVARWLAAVGYLSFFSLLALWRSKRVPFVRYHAAQGFLLFLAEIAFLVAALILEATVGRVKIAGLIVVGVFIFITGMTALILSAIGFVKALFGEYWNMPFLGEWKNRIPNIDSERV